MIQGQFRDYIKNIEIKVRLWNEDNIPPCRGRSGGEGGGGGVAGPMGRLCWKIGRKIYRKREYFLLIKKSSYRGCLRKRVDHIKKIL